MGAVVTMGQMAVLAGGREEDQAQRFATSMARMKATFGKLRM